jgi:hypothetical protein
LEHVGLASSQSHFLAGSANATDFEWLSTAMQYVVVNYYDISDFPIMIIHDVGETRLALL